MKRYLLIVTILLIISYQGITQVTRVKGIIKDAQTGEPIAYASVYVKGTSIYAFTNDSGAYIIETRQKIDSITVSFLGYKSITEPVERNVTQIINFNLQPNIVVFNEVVVRPGENPAHRILRAIINNKAKNRYFAKNIQYNRYSKILISLNNIDEKFKNQKIVKPFSFVFENLDTNSYTGNIYLPIIIAESSVDVFHIDNSPPLKKEIVKATSISGIQDQNILNFFGGLDQSFDIYNNYMDFYTESGFISPISDNGFLFYKYYLLDSAYRNGYKCYNISFKPRRKLERTFFGEFWVVDSIFSIQQLSMRINPQANINFINDLYAEYTYIPLNDSTWVISKEFVQADINLVESKRLKGLQGKKTIVYNNYQINSSLPESIAKSSETIIVLDSAASVNMQQYRPVKLTQKEENTYAMVDSIKNVPAFKSTYNTLKTIIEAHYSFDKFKIGPYFSFYSYNKLEGHRFRIGGVTSEDLSQNIQLTGYIAYGSYDNKWKYYGNVMWILNRKPYTKLITLYRHDVSQIYLAPGELLNENIVSSFFRRYEFTKLQMIDNATIMIERDINPNWVGNLSVNYFKVQSSKYVPFLLKADTSILSQINTSNISIGFHYEKNQKFYNTTFYRYRYLNEKPAFDFNVTIGVKNLLGGQYNFAKTNFKISQYVKTNPFGYNKYFIEMAKIWGNIPWPLLNIFKGNETYGYHYGAFNLMNYYEFVSNEYFIFSTEQHFQGIVLNYIPIIRRLKWREVASFKMAIGRLTSNYDNSILLPDYMQPLQKPYYEVGLGVENVFKFLRFDFIYRLSYLNKPEVQKFGLRASLQFIL